MPTPTFRNLPLAARDRSWDKSAAEAAVRAWAGGPSRADMDWARYRRAHFWYDPEAQDAFAGYKLPYATVDDGRLVAVPRAIIAAAAAINGARGGVALPADDLDAVKGHVSRYYDKMAEEFDDDAIAAPFAATAAPPGCVQLQSPVEPRSIQRAPNGGWTFEALAQAYGAVNDHLFFFFAGSGKKTIAERVAAGRVKIHDGHPTNPSLSATVGKVLSARETAEGVYYTGFISSVHPEVAEKLREGVIDENSLELNLLQTAPHEIPVDEVPAHLRRWVTVAQSGDAIVTGISEWRWMAIGLVSRSSQDVQAILGSPIVTADLALPLAPPDLAANANLSALPAARRRGAHLVSLYDPDGSEANLGRIAGLDGRGRLVLAPDLLAGALEEVQVGLDARGLSDDLVQATLAAAQQVVADYAASADRGLAGLVSDPNGLLPLDGATAASESLTAPASAGTNDENMAPDPEEVTVDTEELAGAATAPSADIEPAAPGLGEAAAEPAPPLTAPDAVATTVANINMRLADARLALLARRIGADL